MAMRILWPNLPARLVPVATEAVGSGFELQFHEKFEDVSDEQWAKADAVVGGCPPPYIDKLKACRIFVKYGVGYDDVDIERFGKLGIPVCNVPDYGTREVADHAIALMMTLAKSVAYHDSELRADLKGNWRPAHNPFGRRVLDCSHFVSNDSGVMNIANALGIPLLALFAPTNVETRLPLGGATQAIVLEKDCAPCELKDPEAFTKGQCICMAEIGVDRVEARLLERIGKAA